MLVLGVLRMDTRVDCLVAPAVIRHDIEYDMMIHDTIPYYIIQYFMILYYITM